MERFFSLPEEKQNRIIDAALSAFGRNGYRKTSVSDIAAAAGISKAMVFYYFGSKLELYRYLADFCAGLVLDAIQRHLDPSVTDFFDRLIAVSHIKISVMAHRPGVMPFLYGILYETDEEAQACFRHLKEKSAPAGWDVFLQGADTSRFKEDIDVRLLMKFLYWAAEGFATELPKESTPAEMEERVEDYHRCLDMIKKYLYKPD